MKIFFKRETIELDSLKRRKIAQLPHDFQQPTIVNFYWIEVDNNKFPSNSLAILEDLLQAEKVTNCSQILGQLFITPRIGTISPWSSRALDIVKNCGINIQNIEYGTAYYWPNDMNNELDTIIEECQLHDPLTQTAFRHINEILLINYECQPKPLKVIRLDQQGITALEQMNEELGLALSQYELHFLEDLYCELKRNPTDIELMMFAQANSEHCRHKIFNAQFNYNNNDQAESLFQKIKYTFVKNSTNVLSAYSDNAAVISGYTSDFMLRNGDRHYVFSNEPINILMKVETHNHPTAISPFEGAATGIGGELRDEGATGRGGRPKAGLTGYCVSNLQIPDLKQPWELNSPQSPHLASALQIMIEAPIGGAAYNNEFGRPNLCGFFRSFYHQTDSCNYGYHKPIMIAGGYGNIRQPHVKKQNIPIQAKLIVLGGPAMKIGLGGGAASSKVSQEADAKLDFSSVQRANPEMQRRCQEVIDHCLSLAENNPIISIHDVGAGGLANAFPELINDANRGGFFELRKIPCDEADMSPLEIWCNESQERYVLAVAEENIPIFSSIAKRERCPYAIVGETTLDQNLIVNDKKFSNQPIALPLNKLFGSVPKMHRNAKSYQSKGHSICWNEIHLSTAIRRVLQLPTVASKQFLITIGDRSVGGHVTRDQFVGPWQIPISNVAVTSSSFMEFYGEAMAIGERSPLALINPAASARIAVGEMLTNILAADINHISDIKLSANWMAACGEEEEDGGLFEAVEAIAKALCPQLGLTIPVGKDSLSMKTQWQQQQKQIQVKSPLSVVITGVSPVRDVRNTLTPDFKRSETIIYFIDLAEGKQRMGGSALLQTYNQLGDITPDVDNPQILQKFFKCLQVLKQNHLISAYHDKSDGGLITCLAEMSFASHLGWHVDFSAFGDQPLATLFNEELGVILEVENKHKSDFMQIITSHELKHVCHILGHTKRSDQMTVTFNGSDLIKENRVTWQRYWQNPSYQIQRLRDNPLTAEQEYQQITQAKPLLFSKLTFKPIQSAHPQTREQQRPKVAILREQGINGHVEMAAAFKLAGFDAIDVHMSDILSDKEDLSTVTGLVACGGFSYGDVLGAGRGWANTILYNKNAKNIFTNFFHRPDTFTLGICNGCQMLSYLKTIIPGAEHFPNFMRNHSDQFEARVSMVEVTPSNSIFFSNMAGSQLPIIVAHGEGRINDFQQSYSEQIAMRYIDCHGRWTEDYPANPNSSYQGITGVTSLDGRVTIMMPHPERMFRTIQCSWHPQEWEEMSPWFTMFDNAYQWALTHQESFIGLIPV